LGRRQVLGLSHPYIYVNHIISLQAVVEIITNEMASALDFLAKQSTKMHNAIYQNRLALDYLLASEGGVCGKFNLSNCCLQIDDEGKVTEEITDRMRKLALVPVQTWKGRDPNDLFGGWFSALGGFKTLIGAMGLSWEHAYSALPGSLVLQSIRTIMEAIIKKKMASHVMMLWKYKPLNF
jgi:hypothetical protein